MFLPLNKKVGVKLYLRKDNRNFSWKHQRILNLKNLAPYAGRCFEIDSGAVSGRYTIYYRPRTLFGFFTEVAEEVKAKNLKGKELSLLCKNLSDQNYSTTDVAARNVGRIKSKLVLIDTDMVSLRK
jgi:hypothetical protein